MDENGKRTRHRGIQEAYCGRTYCTRHTAPRNCGNRPKEVLRMESQRLLFSAVPGLRSVLETRGSLDDYTALAQNREEACIMRSVGEAIREGLREPGYSPR
jgi:hypothetical protein